MIPLHSKVFIFFLVLLFLIALRFYTFSTHAATPSVQISVDPSVSGTPLSAHFMGISSEPADSPCEQLLLDSKNPTLLVNLFTNLGPGTFRFGGDSVEGASWAPSGNGNCSWSGTTQTPSMVNAMVGLMKKIGWRFIWGVNLKNANPANDAANAAYVAQAAGSTLLGIEIGNEPNLYGWSYSQYQTKWETVASAIKNAGPAIPLIGPAGTDCCSDFFTPFINAESAKIVIATDHFYPTANSTTFQTLLSPSLMNNAISQTKPRLQLTTSKNLPYQMGETNAVANVPPASIGNAFGISLWVLDYSLSLADIGVSAMNVHGWSGDATSLFYTNNTPRPNYYGMMAFHYIAPNGTMLPVQVSSGSVNVTAHSIRTADGNLQVAIINKDLSQSASIQINTTTPFANAHAIRLSAPSVDATTGITLGGAAVASDGSWSPKTIESIPVNGATSSVTLPSASAILITYTNASPPSPSVPSGGTSFGITALLHGLGTGGDNVNPNSGGNTSPKHLSRTASVTFINPSGQTVSSAQGTITYDPSSGSFKGTVSSSSIVNGSYLVDIKTQGFLTKQAPGIITVSSGQQTILPQISETTGDVNNDDQLDILDYNIIISCFGKKLSQPSCTMPPTAQTSGADINDDGAVDGVDYNLFIRELSVQKGT